MVQICQFDIQGLVYVVLNFLPQNICFVLKLFVWNVFLDQLADVIGQLFQGFRVLKLKFVKSTAELVGNLINVIYLCPVAEFSKSSYSLDSVW